MGTPIEEFTAKLGWDIDTKTLSTFGRQVEGLKSSLRATFYAGVAGITAFGFGVRRVMKSFSMIEDAEALFTPLLGSVERAALMTRELNTAAAATPFEFQDLAGATQQLLPMMNGEILQTVDFVKMLGDTAGGNAERLQGVVRGFTRIMIKGRADMESLNIIAEKGIPIFKQLQDNMGFKTGAQMFDALRRGKISFEDVTNTFKKMTSEGGIFFKGMEIASKTFSGRMSTMRDEVNLTLAEFGKAIAPLMKDLLEEGIEWVQMVKAWAIANERLIKTEFIAFMSGAVELVKTLVGFTRGLAGFVKGVGGLNNAFKLFMATFAITKLVPILTTMGAMLKTAPTLGAALKGIGATALGTWLKLGGVIGGVFLLLDDVAVTKRGGSSAINKYLVNPILEATDAFDKLGPAGRRAAGMIALDWNRNLIGDSWYSHIPIGLGLAYEYFIDFGDRVGGLLETVGNAIWDSTIGAWWDALQKVWASIKEMFGGAADRFRNLKADFSKSVKGKGSGGASVRTPDRGAFESKKWAGAYIPTRAPDWRTSAGRDYAYEQMQKSKPKGQLTTPIVVNVKAPPGGDAKQLGQIIGTAVDRKLQDTVWRFHQDYVFE